MVVVVMLTAGNPGITDFLQKPHVLLWAFLYQFIFVCPALLASRRVSTGHKWPNFSNFLYHAFINFIIWRFNYDLNLASVDHRQCWASPDGCWLEKVLCDRHHMKTAAKCQNMQSFVTYTSGWNEVKMSFYAAKKQTLVKTKYAPALDTIGAFHAFKVSSTQWLLMRPLVA